MYAIVFVLLLIILAGMAFVVHMESSSMRYDRHSIKNTVRVSAQQGAQVFNACEKESPGVYSVTQLSTGGYLPNGYAQKTPLGPQWECQVSSGGADGKNVIILLMSGPFTNLAGLGSLATRQAVLQNNIAWNLAQDIGPQVVAINSAIVGVLPANSTTMSSIVNAQQYSLAGLVYPQDYATPVIAQNLVATTLS